MLKCFNTEFDIYVFINGYLWLKYIDIMPLECNFKILPSTCASVWLVNVFFKITRQPRRDIRYQCWRFPLVSWLSLIERTFSMSWFFKLLTCKSGIVSMPLIDFSRSWLSCLGFLVDLLPKTFKLFGFPIFWLWAYLVISTFLFNCFHSMVYFIHLKVEYTNTLRYSFTLLL
jgi:hypothetical protein